MKGKLTTIMWEPGDPLSPGKTNFARLKRMTEVDIERGALADRENPPLTQRELAKFKPVGFVSEVDVKKVRERIGLSQTKFADYFGVSVRTIQDWEQHRHKPNRTARNFLTVITKEPRAVQRALSSILRKTA